MQVISVTDQEFPELLELWQTATRVGEYRKNHTVHLVAITAQFLLVSLGESPRKIAMKSARDLSEARSFAFQILNKEQKRGNEVRFEERN